jgi:hypothetical protein
MSKTLDQISQAPASAIYRQRLAAGLTLTASLLGRNWNQPFVRNYRFNLKFTSIACVSPQAGIEYG